MTIKLRSGKVLSGDALKRFLDERNAAQGFEAFKLDKETPTTAIVRTTPAIVRAPEGVPSEPKLKSLLTERGMDWDEAYVGRFRSYFASDERVDDYGDIVRQSWDFSDFEKNSPLLYQHNWHHAPIGRCIDWGVVQRKDADYTGPALTLLCLFANSDEGQQVFDLVSRGFMPSGSVGFRSGRVIRVEDDGERAELGLGKWGVILENNKLREFSPVSIPANAGATVRSMEASKVTRADIDLVREFVRGHVARTSGKREEFYTWEHALLGLARKLDPTTPVTVHRDLDMPLGLAQLESGEALPEPEPQPQRDNDSTPTQETRSGDASADVLRRLSALERSLGERLDTIEASVRDLCERGAPPPADTSGEALADRFSSLDIPESL